MWYIHKKGDEYVITRDKPKKPYIELEKHPIIPVEDGCIPILKADFKIGEYWFEQHETDEHKKKTEIAALKRWFDNDYRTLNEKYTRFATLKIDYTYTDEFRNVEYKSLADLYAEAEKVRTEIHELEDSMLEREESEGQ